MTDAVVCQMRVQAGGGGTCCWNQGDLLCWGCQGANCPNITILGGGCAGMLLVDNVGHCIPVADCVVSGCGN